jgi:hypothetical protein
VISSVAGTHVRLDEAERHGALRRAELLLATGGDPHRELDPHGRAVTSVAQDLDSPLARSLLRAGLVALACETADLAEVDAARERLLADLDLAWQLFAYAALADAISQ